MCKLQAHSGKMKKKQQNCVFGWVERIFNKIAKLKFEFKRNWLNFGTVWLNIENWNEIATGFERWIFVIFYWNEDQIWLVQRNRKRRKKETEIRSNNIFKLNIVMSSNKRLRIWFKLTFLCNLLCNALHLCSCGLKNSQRDVLN